MSDVLEAVLEVFGCDRVRLVYPCDPEAASWQTLMEHTRPQFRRAARDEIPATADVARVHRVARALGGAVMVGPCHDFEVPASLMEPYGVRSFMFMALYPKVDEPYLFSLHQCSHARAWTEQEQRLFQEIGRRLTDAVTNLLMLRRLQESEARFRTLVDHATDAFFLHDEDGTILDVNSQACASLGYARDELIGMHPKDFDPDINDARLKSIMERLDAGEIVVFETRHRRKDASVFPVEIRVRPFRQRGRMLRVALVQDVSERKHAEAERAKLEDRLRQAEKMEAIGRFASGIAHDFNNVLGGIIAYGEMLCDEAPEGAPRQRYAQNVLTAATRGRDLVDQILAYTRGQRGKRRPTDICRTVAETLELVRSSLPDSITLHPAIPDVPLVVVSDATQIHQVVMNLCSNSIHAMRAGGPLRVAIEPVDVRVDRVLSHGTLRPGGYVCISVEDGGCGMDKATLARIFEPFFTTKEIGRGTGLGLALVYAIVADFGGVINVKSVPNEGSTFSIYLPITDAHVQTK